MALNIRPLMADRFSRNNIDTLPSKRELEAESINTRVELENESLSEEERAHLKELSKSYYQKLLNVVS